MAFLIWVLNALMACVMVYYIMIHVLYVVTMFASARELRQNMVRMKTVECLPHFLKKNLPGLTMIAPAWNEEVGCVESVRTMLTQDYPGLVVMVVNDGSTDHTMRELTKAFDLQLSTRMPTGDIPTSKVHGIYQSRTNPSLWVLDKENGGKADALNAGVNYLRTPLFCAMDSDTLMDPGAMIEVVRPFMLHRETVASSGIVRIANGCQIEHGVVKKVTLPDEWAARFQNVEYLRAFLAGRQGLGRMNSLLIISGAFGVFDSHMVREVGGYLRGTVGEDMELVVRLHRYCLEGKRPYRIVFVPDPVAWTECPESLEDLGRQRDRWQRGLMDSLLRHRRMMMNPKYGLVGMLAFPFFVLEMIGPVIEILGYLSFAGLWAAGQISWSFTLAYFGVSLGTGFVISGTAIVLEEYSLRRFGSMRDLVLLFWVAWLENFGYRQLTVWWRLKGVVSYFLGQKHWGQMSRKGFGDTAGVTDV